VTKLRRAARRAAGRTGVPRAVLTGLAVLTLASCSGGAIAASTPLSNGTSYVGGSYSSVYYKPGSRPLAPKVTGTTLTGAKWSLASERGDLVVLNFWGSWCAPCRREAPALAALAAHFKAAPVRFVGDDVHDSPASAKAFEQSFNVGYPSLNDPGEQVALAFHGTVPPVAIPTTLLIDRTGHVAGRIVGGVSYDSLRTLIDKILAEKA
jgi:thiol-disulfide isomerase/thioredoxin